jgi:glucose 1-dehydrogenase
VKPSVECLGKVGASVSVDYLARPEDAVHVVRDIESAGSRAVVSREADVEHLFDQTLERLGAVDILANNDGIQKEPSWIGHSIRGMRYSR